MKAFKIVLIFMTIIFLSSCKHKRPRPHSYAQPSRYQQVPTYNPSSYNRGSHKVVVSRSMHDLDRDSASVKPTLVYSYKASSYASGRKVNINNLTGRMLNYINTIRARGNVCAPPAPPVRWSNELQMAADFHANDMASNNFLGHVGSGKATDKARKGMGRGSNFYERIIYAGYPIMPGRLAGEVLTYTKYSIVGNQDPYEHFMHAVANFQKSPRHCQIIMNPRFKDMGLSAYKDNEKIYWVIEFGEPSR